MDSTHIVFCFFSDFNYQSAHFWNGRGEQIHWGDGKARLRLRKRRDHFFLIWGYIEQRRQCPENRVRIVNHTFQYNINTNWRMGKENTSINKETQTQHRKCYKNTKQSQIVLNNQKCKHNANRQLNHFLALFLCWRRIALISIKSEWVRYPLCEMEMKWSRTFTVALLLLDSFLP
jgi:hypothetical protein